MIIIIWKASVMSEVKMKLINVAGKTSRLFNRREALFIFGALSAGALIGGCGGDNSTGNGGSNSCVITPTLTEGPFFVDERLNRSNIIGGQPGLPLQLSINVYNASTSACSAFAGVQVDVWHA